MAKYESLDILDDAAELDRQHKRQVTLTWSLVKFKLMYYYPELVDEEFKKPLTISDEKYDKLRTEYLGLTNRLLVDNLIVDGLAKDGDTTVRGAGMREIDFDKPFVKSSLNYVGIDDWEDAVKALKGKGLPAVDSYAQGLKAGQKKAEEDADMDEMAWGYGMC